MWLPAIFRSLTTGARRPAADDRRVPSRLAVEPLEARSLPSGFSTYLGGSVRDTGYGIAVDAAGYTYVVGYTESTDFPATIGSAHGFADVFVAKLGPDGSLAWAGVYGGNNNDFPGSGIALDGSGGLYLTGHTASADFPTTPGAFDATYNGPNGNAFVMKLDTATGAVVYSTYLGSDQSVGNAVAVDAAGNAYVTGDAYPGFPITPGTAQPVLGGGGVDAFVTKLNAAGSALVYSTYLGGSGGEDGLAIAVDASGNAYVTGLTTPGNFPTTAGAFQTTYAGGLDAFVTKLNATGSAFTSSTYFGGTDEERGYGIAVDAFGSAYVTGITRSADFPTTAGAYDTIADGVGDAFVFKLNPDGSAPIYSTYLGGTYFATGYAIAVDGSGNTYITGQTASADLPTTAEAFDPTFDGPADAFITEVDAAGGGLVYSTYLGGTGYDYGGGIALDAFGGVYTTGFAEGTDFPTTAGAFDTTANGATDVFVTRLQIGTVPVPVTIEQAAGQADPTAGPISFDVAFAAPVTGFDETDIDFTGSTVGGTLIAEVAGSGALYTVTVGGMTGAGTVVASVPAGAAIEPDGGPTLASTSTDNTVTFDGVAPTVTVEQAAGQADPTTAGPITFTVHFSEPVTGFDGSDVSFAGSTVGGTLVADVTGSGADYTVTVTGMIGQGTVVVSIPVGAVADAAGNGNAASIGTDNTVTFDNQAPTVTIDQAVGQTDPTNVASVQFDVKFSEPVTGFGPADVDLGQSTAGGAFTITVTGSLDTYLVTVTGMTTRGSVIASIPAGIATDIAGNPNLQSTSTDNSIDFLNTGTLGFTQAVYNTNEGDTTHTVTITVTRAGQTEGAVSIDYGTSDGTAHSGGPATQGQADYTPASGTLTWADGEGGDKTFTVDILPDNFNEGMELINLALTNPVGSPGLGLTSSAVAIAPSNPFVLSPTARKKILNDADGDRAKITFGGPVGSASIYMTDPDGDGKGPIEWIELNGTLPDPLKPRTSLAVAVNKNKLTGDGVVNIGAITGSGLRSIAAPRSNLTLDGINLNGYLGSLTIGNILNGADITTLATTNPKQKSRITAGAIGDGTAIKIAASVSGFTATSFGAGSLTVPSVGTLIVRGAMAANLNISGAGVDPTKKALGTLQVKGAVTGSDIMVNGNIGAVVVGSFRDCRLFAGYTGPDIPDPAGFNLAATVTAFRVTSKVDGFQNCRVIATAFKSVALTSLDSINPAGPFGFYADASLGTITVIGPTRWAYHTGLPTPQGLGDFEVKIV